MTIKELYEWAKEKEIENYPILIDKNNRIENISGAEIVDKDNIFNGIFFKVDTKSIILK
jgi:hypothetical protein